MDLSVLPNNNHPDKFLRLDVKTLFNSTALYSQHWHNRVYRQNDNANVIEPPQTAKTEIPAIVDKALREHFTPEVLKSTIKSNPLYLDLGNEEKVIPTKKQPSWTVLDYDKQSPNPRLSRYMKENPHEIKFWLEDIYTPGYDTLLKKMEKEQKKTKLCKLLAFLALGVCILIAIVTVTVLLT
ncbi:major intrinsically disordered NOTCH2-binding receptor 1-like [Hyperolius riggenbachi]|uniref:major intrinsically disordered NOTCH2-binding receptor 1-like n=1 Tax=Hyperolius riggenbachi TaxID=752182 RepID=UPI0035A38F84